MSSAVAFVFPGFAASKAWVTGFKREHVVPAYLCISSAFAFQCSRYVKSVWGIACFSSSPCSDQFRCCVLECLPGCAREGREVIPSKWNLLLQSIFGWSQLLHFGDPSCEIRAWAKALEGKALARPHLWWTKVLYFTFCFAVSELGMS